MRTHHNAAQMAVQAKPCPNYFIAMADAACDLGEARDALRALASLVESCCQSNAVPPPSQLAALMGAVERDVSRSTEALSLLIATARTEQGGLNRTGFGGG